MYTTLASRHDSFMATYLTKKEILREIHESKKSYSHYLDPKYADYHHIVTDKSMITADLVDEIVHLKENPKGRAKAEVIAPEDVVIRVMTHSHIPLDPDRKRKARNTDKSYARTNFSPFRQFILKNGVLVEVGRSHWKGDLDTGCFCIDHGSINNKLATMFMLLVERIARKPNFRGYSYREEMEGYALVQLCQSGLMFDESKSSNPFAFLTTSVIHSFVRILNLEKRARDIRDDLMLSAGATPSITKQIEHELAGMFDENGGRANP